MYSRSAARRTAPSAAGGSAPVSPARIPKSSWQCTDYAYLDQVNAVGHQEACIKQTAGHPCDYVGYDGRAQHDAAPLRHFILEVIDPIKSSAFVAFAQFAHRHHIFRLLALLSCGYPGNENTATF